MNEESLDKGKETRSFHELPPKLKRFIRLAWGIIALFRFLRRIRVRGLEHLRSTPWENRLLLPNHPSTLDPILIPLLGFMPNMLRDPEQSFPWQTPNGGFETNPEFAFLKELPIIFLKTDEKGRPNDAMAVREIMRRLKKSTFIVFPEGTRSYHSDEPRIKTASGIEIGKAREGIPFIIAHSRPTVIPVLVKGTNKVLPLDTKSLRSGFVQVITRLFLHRIEIVFGKPLDLAPFFEKKAATREEKEKLYEELGQAVIEGIAALDTKRSKKGGTRRER